MSSVVGHKTVAYFDQISKDRTNLNSGKYVDNQNSKSTGKLTNSPSDRE